MVTVEPATPADADAVADLWVELARDQRRHGTHLRAEANRETVRQSLAEHAADGGLVVARDDGIVGFARFTVERGPLVQESTRGVVRDLYVRSSWRDDSIGTRLLNAAETTLADRGVDIVAIEALARNTDAIRFYESRGYRPHRIEFEREVENDKRPRGDR